MLRHPRAVMWRAHAAWSAGRDRTDRGRDARADLRRGPSKPGGLRRVHVGCGPHHHLAGWWNVDIRPFPGVDEVFDATRPWPWADLEAVYGEHFLEHLPLDGAVAFLAAASRALAPGGVLRLSTPGLEWVWLTHLAPHEADPEVAIGNTYRANRAFHGWGHQFLYSRPMLEHLLGAVGFVELRFHAWGESDRPELRGLERHAGFELVEGMPSVWIVEALRGQGAPEAPQDLLAEVEREYVRFVRAGH